MKGFQIIHSSLHTLKVHTNFIFPSLLKYTCSLSVLSSEGSCVLFQRVEVVGEQCVL